MAKNIDVASLNRLNYAAFENTVRPKCHGYIEYVNSMGRKVREKCTMQLFDFQVLLRSGYTEDRWKEYFPYEAYDSSIKSRFSNMRDPEIGNKALRDYEIDTYSEEDVLDRVF